MKKERLNPSVTALIYLFFAYLIVVVISYSTFLQIPVFDGEFLLWKSILEQFTTWIPIILAYLFLFVTIANLPRRKESLIDEVKLIIPGSLLLFLSAFSVGIHAISQIIEDYLINDPNTKLYLLVLFFDEFVGHLFLITLTVTFFLMALLELNKKQKTLSRLDNTLIIIIGLLNGLVQGLSGVEGGSMYLAVIPVTIVLFIYLLCFVRKNNLNINKYPFSKHFLIATGAMLIFSLYWIFGNGWLSQPSDFGFELFNF